ncbi:hypothetical protein SAMN04490247_0882 [Salimicrobium halophilum]|uniref:Uncharacterized protein n=1 Tax=Salimicrobium halophilum TaxID=86666 RepID=A0A1G8R7Q7_9BACI|nr:hypothetical protein SAMN04490247_0882 [Salimicrobium halophilum]
MEFIMDMLIGIGLVFFILVTFVIFYGWNNRK